MSKLEELKADLVKAEAAYDSARDKHTDSCEALEDATEYLAAASGVYSDELEKEDT